MGMYEAGGYMDWLRKDLYGFTNNQDEAKPPNVKEDEKLVSDSYSLNNKTLELKKKE